MNHIEILAQCANKRQLALRLTVLKNLGVNGAIWTLPKKSN